MFNKDEANYVNIFFQIQDQRRYYDGYLGTLIMSDIVVFLQELGYERYQRLIILDKVREIDRTYVQMTNEKIRKDRDKEMQEAKKQSSARRR